MPSYTHTHEAELRPFTSAPPAPQVFMRNAPVLRMPKGPVRGGPKEAMARKALALAHVRAEEERRTMLWKSHVFEENLKQQTRALMRGATNAARDQRETNLLTASLEMTLATLAGAERSLARGMSIRNPGGSTAHHGKTPDLAGRFSQHVCGPTTKSSETTLFFGGGPSFLS